MRKRKKGNPNQHNWTNRRADGSYVARGKNWTYWRNQTCPHCGRKYRYFRMEMDRTDIFMMLKQEHDNGDRKAHSIRTQLGKQHEKKQEAWEAHIEVCRVEAIAKGGGKVDPDEVREVMEEACSAPGYFVDYKGKRI